jgi:hypothetical protein
MTDRHSSCLRPLSLSQHMAARVAALRCHARASRSPASLRASMSSSSVPPRKLRVLALHSFRTSGEILKAQMEIAGWHKQDVLGDMCEFVCAPDGLPATGPIPEDVAMFFPEPTYAYHEWWNATKVEGSMEYVGLEESLERVRAAWEDSGPFDGVMGFSQGATMTTLLAAKGVVEGWGPFAASSGRRAIPFAICVSGALPRTEATRGLLASASAKDSSISSLHIIGEADRVVPPALSERAADCGAFREATVVRHERGHVVPRLQGEVLVATRAFLAEMLRDADSAGRSAL